MDDDRPAPTRRAPRAGRRLLAGLVCAAVLQAWLHDAPGALAATHDQAVPARAGAAAEADRTRQWQDAVQEADRPHLDELVQVRPAAALVGLAWLGLALRRRARRWKRTRRARA